MWHNQAVQLAGEPPIIHDGDISAQATCEHKANSDQLYVASGCAVAEA
jgi:hypothetical protein